MKRILTAFLFVLSCTFPVFASEEPMPGKQIDYLEQVVYGSTRNGGMLTRLDNIEKDLYGMQLNGSLAERQAAHVDFLKDGANGQPSLLFKMSVAEWGLEMPNNAALPLEERIPLVEKRLAGTNLGDKPLAMRVERVLGMIITDPVSWEKVTVPAGTVARLQLMETLSPSKVKKGDKVLFRLTRNIVIGNKLVASVGAPAEAVITKVRKPRSFGRPSEIHVKISSLDTLGSQILPMVEGENSKKATEFEASYAAAAGTSLAGALAFGPVGLVGGFFIKGNAHDIPAGAIMYVETEKDCSVFAYPVPTSLDSLLSTKDIDLMTGREIKAPALPDTQAAPDTPSTGAAPAATSEIDNL